MYNILQRIYDKQDAQVKALRDWIYSTVDPSLQLPCLQAEASLTIWYKNLKEHIGQDYA